MDNINNDLDIKLDAIKAFGSAESTENTENTESTENTETTESIEDTETTENTETAESTEDTETTENIEDATAAEDDGAEHFENAEVPGGGALMIPEEDHRADEVLSGMAIDTVRGHYTFFNLAVLITTVFAIALTLLLMRETDRYGEDNVKLSFETFLDGSYTQAMSNRYLSRLNIDTLAEKIENISGHLYGFGGMVKALPDDEVSPDDQPNAGYVTNFPEYTTTTASMTEASQVTTESVSAVVDPALTGTAVTMKPSSITVETSFTGRVSIYTTLTSEFTSTGAYRPTATKPKTTPPATKPPSVSQSESPTSSETTPEGSETTPDTSSETSSETTPSEVDPSVTTTPLEAPAP